MVQCHHCGRKIEKGSECYQVKIIAYDGRMCFIKTCSPVCANLAKGQNADFHQKRSEEVEFQSIQKMLLE